MSHPYVADPFDEEAERQGGVQTDPFDVEAAKLAATPGSPVVPPLGVPSAFDLPRASSDATNQNARHHAPVPEAPRSDLGAVAQGVAEGAREFIPGTVKFFRDVGSTLMSSGMQSAREMDRPLPTDSTALAAELAAEQARGKRRVEAATKAAEMAYGFVEPVADIAALPFEEAAGLTTDEERRARLRRAGGTLASLGLLKGTDVAIERLRGPQAPATGPLDTPLTEAGRQGQAADILQSRVEAEQAGAAPPTPGIRRRIANLLDPEQVAEAERLRAENEQLQTERRNLEAQAYTDPLTDLGNRRGFDAAIQRVSEVPGRESAIIDIVNHKANNEVSYEHGDEYLKRVAVAMQQVAEEMNVDPRNLFRHGGDEFSVADLPEGQGAAFIQRLQELMPPEEAAGFPVSVRGAVGRTPAELDFNLKAVKATETGPRLRPMDPNAPSEAAGGLPEDPGAAAARGDETPAMQEAATQQEAQRQQNLEAAARQAGLRTQEEVAALPVEELTKYAKKAKSARKALLKALGDPAAVTELAGRFADEGWANEQLRTRLLATEPPRPVGEMSDQHLADEYERHAAGAKEESPRAQEVGDEIDRRAAAGQREAPVPDEFDQAAAPEEAPPVTSAPVPPFKFNLRSKKGRAEYAAARAAYFTPGNRIPSYGGGVDEVVAYHPGDPAAAYPDNHWHVDVREVVQGKDGVERLGEVRSHSTEPSLKELADVRGGDEAHASLPLNQDDFTQAAEVEVPSTGKEEPSRPTVPPEDLGDHLPALPSLRNTLHLLVDDLRRTFAPANRGPGARTAAGVLRARLGESARHYAQVEHLLTRLGTAFDKMSTADQLAFDDRLETGRPQPTPELRAIDEALRAVNDALRDRVFRRTGKLAVGLQNYLAHIWERPEQAAPILADIMSRRPLEGSKGFLHQRTTPTIAEGMAKGLKLVTANPVDLTLIKAREMLKYESAHAILDDLGDLGLLRSVSVFDKPPTDWMQIKDPVATIHGPPETMVREAYDAMVRGKLDEVIGNLGGLVHERKTSGLGGAGRLGYAQGANKMVTRAGSLDAVTMHELGHILDKRYDLWDRLVEPALRETRTNRAGELVERPARQPRAAVKARKQILQELGALADLRGEGQEVTPHQQAYFRNRPEQIANAVAAFIYTPEKMAEVAPGVQAKLRAFFAADPKLAPLLEIKPSLVWEATEHPQALPGFPVIAHRYAPEPVATVLNHHLSPGLGGNRFYRGYRQIGNLMLSARLGASAYHLGFTSLDAIISKQSLALEQLAAGRGGAALASLAESPFSPVTNWRQGRRIQQEALDPGTHPELAPIVHALTQGGARFQQEGFYRLGEIEKFREQLRKVRYDGAPVRTKLGQALGLTGRTLPALVDLVSKPIFKWVVPQQKLGVMADLMRAEMERLGPDATPEQVKAAAAKVVDTVDDRMGQMVYDNLFWHKTLKDLGMASVQSLGWNIGDIRALGGAGVDVAKLPARVGRRVGIEAGVTTPEPGEFVAGPKGKRGAAIDPLLSHKMAYALTLPLTVGMIGAIVQYLATGQKPQELKDYFYPRTGRKNPDGTDERMQLPSYVRDAVGYARDPWGTIKHKLNPLAGTIAETLENRDFYGNMIRNPDDPAVQELQQELLHMVGAFEPYATRQARESLKRGQSPGVTALPFVGITPAPRWAVRSEAQNRMSELLRRRGITIKTPEQTAELDWRRGVERTLSTDRPAGIAALQDAVRSHRLSMEQAMGMLEGTARDPEADLFKQLTLEEALDVYQQATPAERDEWWPALVAKWETATQRGDAPALDKWQAAHPQDLPRAGAPHR